MKYHYGHSNALQFMGSQRVGHDQVTKQQQQIAALGSLGRVNEIGLTPFPEFLLGYFRAVAQFLP